MDLKLMALRIILEAKDTLFGSFSDSLTKQDKRRKWEEIATKYQSLGVVSAAKDYKYVRDVYWPNIKKSTMAKVDNAKKTGSAGGAGKKLTAVDELVLQILGKDSPTVAGLHAVDILDENKEEELETFANKTLEPAEIEIHDEARAQNPENKTIKRKTIVMEGSQKHTELKEINNLKKKKLELEIENIKLQNYNLQLDIYKKEKEFNIKSQYSLYPETEEVLLITDTCRINEDGTVPLLFTLILLLYVTSFCFI